MDVYTKQIRSLVEFAAPVWHSNLTGEDRFKIERVQKSALSIILGEQYYSYRSGLKNLRLESLYTRRGRLCKKSQKHSKFEKWFKPNTRITVTRAKGSKFCEVHCRTERFKNSPISFLTKLLNSDWSLFPLTTYTLHCDSEV